jgi:hypothetical protein
MWDLWDPKEGITLLKSKLLEDKSPERDVITLVDELGCLLLAIKQPVASGSNCSSSNCISQYLQYFKKNEKQQEAPYSRISMA